MNGENPLIEKADALMRRRRTFVASTRADDSGVDDLPILTDIVLDDEPELSGELSIDALSHTEARAEPFLQDIDAAAPAAPLTANSEPLPALPQEPELVALEQAQIVAEAPLSLADPEAMLQERLAAALPEALEARLAEELPGRVEERLREELPARVQSFMDEILPMQVEERIAELLPAQVDEKVSALLPERLEAALAEALPLRLARAKTEVQATAQATVQSWLDEALPELVQQELDLARDRILHQAAPLLQSALLRAFQPPAPAGDDETAVEHPVAPTSEPAPPYA